jgi:hypothetical protein
LFGRGKEGEEARSEKDKWRARLIEKLVVAERGKTSRDKAREREIYTGRLGERALML